MHGGHGGGPRFVRTQTFDAAGCRNVPVRLGSLTTSRGQRRRAGPGYADLGKSPHGQRSTESGIAIETGVTADHTQAVGRIGQTRGEADPGPATDAGIDADVLLALVRI